MSENLFFIWLFLRFFFFSGASGFADSATGSGEVADSRAQSLKSPGMASACGDIEGIEGIEIELISGTISEIEERRPPKLNELVEVAACVNERL